MGLGSDVGKGGSQGFDRNEGGLVYDVGNFKETEVGGILE